MKHVLFFLLFSTLLHASLMSMQKRKFLVKEEYIQKKLKIEAMLPHVEKWHQFFVDQDLQEYAQRSKKLIEKVKEFCTSNNKQSSPQLQTTSNKKIYNSTRPSNMTQEQEENYLTILRTLSSKLEQQDFKNFILKVRTGNRSFLHSKIFSFLQEEKVISHQKKLYLKFANMIKNQTMIPGIDY